MTDESDVYACEDSSHSIILYELLLDSTRIYCLLGKRMALFELFWKRHTAHVYTIDALLAFNHTQYVI
jgi:hypothetical protein